MPWFDSCARGERAARIARSLWRRSIARGRAETGWPTLPPAAPRVDEAAALRGELHGTLRFWRAHAVDPAGGYVVHLERDGTAYDRARRFSAMQARMVYAFSLFPEDAPRAAHGVAYLLERFRDRRHGGFHHTLDAHDGDKHAFDQAYVAIGLLASGDARARAVAGETLHLTERLWEDGYAERGDAAFRVKRPAKTICVQLDLLAAFVALGDGARARRVAEVIVERMIDRDSGLALEVFRRDWRYDRSATFDRVLIGHNLKAAYFLLPFAPDVAERLAVRAVERGWDRVHGGFFQDVFRTGGVARTDKLWWPQCEGLAALYALAARNPSRWLPLARAHADWCRRTFQDPVYGGWYTLVARDGRVINARKGGDYKAALHETQGWRFAADAMRDFSSGRGELVASRGEAPPSN